jgi:hypothetical protein
MGVILAFSRVEGYGQFRRRREQKAILIGHADINRGAEEMGGNSGKH